MRRKIYGHMHFMRTLVGKTRRDRIGSQDIPTQLGEVNTVDKTCNYQKIVEKKTMQRECHLVGFQDKPYFIDLTKQGI